MNLSRYNRPPSTLILALLYAIVGGFAGTTIIISFFMGN